MKKIDVIAIIPARGGSKRIPRKNIKNFHGMPIIAYSIKAALASDIFSDVMISTDDEEIAEIAKKYGASVPFYRSRETSTDTATIAEVLLEVLNEYKKRGQYFEYLCNIYPCAPFISPDLLQEGLQLLITQNADSVVPVVKFSYPPQRCLVMRNNRLVMLYPENYNMRSQDLEPQYHDAGQFCFIRSAAIKKTKSMFCEYTLPMILSENTVQDIDTDEDWQIAEMKYKQGDRS
jgi:N-acylneuraminate cytidylyltransferase